MVFLVAFAFPLLGDWDDSAVAVLSLRTSRDLRRLALLEWIVPFLAARSRLLTASRVTWVASSALPERIEASAFFRAVLTALRTARLRRFLFSDWR